jgi:membrane-bound serine protease (ClpP class)
VPKHLVLHTAGAQVTRVEMGFWKRALDLLIDPNIIAMMLSIGLIGIVVELWHPGLILPGTVGAISLVVGLYGLQVLPVSIAGALLMLLAAAFFVAEAFITSHGALTVAGAVTFVIGSLMLFDPAGPAYQVSIWTALAVALTLAALLGVALTRVVKARKAPVEVDVHRLVGLEGVVRSGDYVFVGGELWRAHTPDGAQLVPGTRVHVDDVEDDLLLTVSPTSLERRAS